MATDRGQPPGRDSDHRSGDPVGSGLTPPLARAAGSLSQTGRVPALAVGAPELLRAALERLGIAPLVEFVAVRLPAAATEPDPPAGPTGGPAGSRDPRESPNLSVLPWPEGLDWLARAKPGSALGSGQPCLLVSGEPARIFLLVETPAEALPAALAPAAASPLVGLTDELRALRTENRELREALEARKAIERAKGILMEQERISESEAFSRIQRLSMSKRKSMKEISEAIILSHELTGRPR